MTYIGLADRLDCSRSEAKQRMDDYFQTFPNLKIFFDEAEKESKETLQIVGVPPTNRIRFFEYPENNSDYEAIAREGKNLKIQEACASILKIALIKLRKEIIKNNYPAKLHLPVHDSPLIFCRV